MAQVQRDTENMSPIVLPGMEVTDSGFAATDLAIGDPVVISGPGPTVQYDQAVSKATGDDANVVGLSVKNTKAGGKAEYASQGEMEGFVGLTPGASLYIANGALDDAAPAEGVTRALIRAVNATRIRFVFV